MSRKGNSPDNGMMESFFGILKSEMFYGYEKSFQSLKQLEQAIVDYIDYYNNWTAPQKLDRKKSNFWGIFIMKLTYDDKVQIYELRKQGYSLEKRSNKSLIVYVLSYEIFTGFSSQTDFLRSYLISNFK